MRLPDLELLRGIRLLCTSVVIAACDRDTAGPPLTEVIGVYVLEVPQGGSVEVRHFSSSGEPSRKVSGGILDLHPDLFFEVRYSPLTGPAWFARGGYSLTKAGVNLRYDNGPSQSAVLRGDTLRVNAGYGETLVFRKIGS